MLTGGGDSIDIDQEEITSLAAQIAAKAEALQSAKTDAENACKDAISQFLPGDSNRATLETVLTNGTKDISSAISTLNEFSTKLKESSKEWTDAEDIGWKERAGR
jgi:predicted transcriptional regulator